MLVSVLQHKEQGWQQVIRVMGWPRVLYGGGEPRPKHQDAEVNLSENPDYRQTAAITEHLRKSRISFSSGEGSH